MCGISGIYNFDGKPVDKNVLKRINDTIIHRGPDNGDVWVNDNVGLGHRRLSIIDLSNRANQPMSACDGRYHIVYNGEIYNFLDIRRRLEKLKHKFITGSDTEVILKAYIEYGYNCFSMFNGMFALSIFDSLKKEMIVARDHYGIKPLYYYKDKNILCFGSEIKVIKAHPKVKLSLCEQALTEYIWFGNPLGENTIYKEIKELKPGSFLSISDNVVHEFKFFDLNSIKEIKEISEEKAIGKIKNLIEDGIKRHLISDVSLGILLSGGIDSSVITAYASKHYNGRIKTFSIGFDYDVGENELLLASKVAKKYNTEHEEIIIRGNNIISTIEALSDAHDEPFGDAANIPLYLISKKLKGRVKVVLQGDGGDEFFGGYSRYNTMNSLKKWNLISSFLLPLLDFFSFNNTRTKQLERFLNAISTKDFAIRNALLLTMESKNLNPINIFNNTWRNILLTKDPFKVYKDVYGKYKQEINLVQALFYTDTQIILKDTFFEKVDKATMANSLEVRVPFMDLELTKFMLSLPAEVKVKEGNQKYLLKKAMRGIVPDEILDRKKKGFGVPYSYWLKTSLKDYFISQITTSIVGKYLDRGRINMYFQEHCRGKGNYGFLLWKVLIFSVWLNRQGEI